MVGRTTEPGGRGPRSNAREPIAGLVGRDDALDALDAAFGREGRRWVTLRGVFGVGKSALARHFAVSQPLAAWPGGVWVCDVSRARRPADVTIAVARVLGARQHEGARGVGEALDGAHGRAGARGRGRTLLVLDGVDGVAASLGPLVEAWLLAAPALAVLVTSQARVSGEGETTMVVSPLAEVDGVALFQARAREARGGRAVRAGAGADRSALSALARAAGGVPLAIELLAEEAVALSPRELVARADGVLDALLAPDPHARRKVDASRRGIDAAFHRASPRARGVLLALSSFARAVALELAEAVIAAVAPGPLGTLALNELCDRSLVVAEEGPGGTVLELPVLVRRYARSKGAGARAAREHRARWARVVLAATEGWATVAGSPEAVANLEVHREDLEAIARDALRGGRPGEAARSVLVLAALASLRSSELELDVLLAETLAHERSLGVDVTSRLRHARARAARRAGRPRLALAEIALAFAAAEQAKREDLARVASDWADLLRHQGRLDEARALYDRALALDEARGDDPGRARTLSSLASMLHEEGDLVGARARFEEAVGILSETADGLALATLRQNLGLVLQESGDLAGAERTFRRARTEHRRLGHRRYEAIAELDLACLALERGRVGEALEGASRASALAARSGDLREAGLAAAILGACRSMLGRPGAVEAFAEARRTLLALEEPALVEALELHEGLLDLARARAAHLAGAGAAIAARWIAAVDARIERGAIASREISGDEVRFALRVLRRERASWSAQGAAIAQGGAWFVTEGAGRVNLARRAVLRALLGALAEEHARAPGAWLAPITLARAAWPGLHVMSRDEKNRLHVAVATLRRLGLGQHLASGPSGYRLERAHVVSPDGQTNEGAPS